MNDAPAPALGSGPRSWSDDVALAEAALEGEPAALQRLLALLQSPELRRSLVSRGASFTEAEDVAGDLAGDCFAGQKVRGGAFRLLAHYNGKGSLLSFLRHVALRRLIDLKRRQAAHPRAGEANASSPGDPLDRLSHGMAVTAGGDDLVVGLLAEALRRAFATADQESLLLFRLVHGYGVPQKDIARMWGWTESTLSRRMKALGSHLRSAVLDEARRADPWLELRWDDFVSLCRESIDLFEG